MTCPSEQPAILHRALAALHATEAPSLPARLLAASSRAAEAGDWRLAWLLADRLARLNPGNGEAYCLRAAAHARLGNQAAAMADLDEARSVAPDHPVVLALDMRCADPALRRNALERALLGKDAGMRHAALAHLAADGIDAIMVATETAGTITARLYWNTRPTLSLHCTDGETDEALPPLASAGSAHPDWPHSAPLAMGWRGRQQALVFQPAHAGGERPLRFVQAPAILHRDGVARNSPGRPAAAPGPAPLLILIPVYADAAATLACLDSVLASGTPAAGARILAIDDASPDAALVCALQRLAEEQRIILLRNPLNLGFARSINRGLALRRRDEDVLLLNADTLIPPGALDRLAAVVAEPSIGTATPLSNNGEDTSFPLRFGINAMPDMAELIGLDELAQQANPGLRIDLPNGVGFCLCISRDALAAVGPLSTDFGRGYYEDVEFCLRVRQAGFRNVCAADVIVGHHGSRSFAGEKAALVRRNQKTLEARFPAYREQARAYRLADPLREAIGRIEDLWLSSAAHGLHLIIAMRSLPDWLCEQLLDRAQAAGRDPVLARIGRSEAGLELSFQARGRFPRNLRLHLPPAAAGDPEAIRTLLHRHRWAGISLIEAEDLLPALRDACGGAALAVARLAPASPAPSATRRTAPDTPLPASARRQTQLALILDDGGTAESGLVAEFARHQPQLALALLGTAKGNDAEAPALWPAGDMARDEIGDWLRQAGITACLVASRPYGLADAHLPKWLAAGLRIAVFDSNTHEARQETTSPPTTSQQTTWLRLPANLPDADVVRHVMDWLGHGPAACR